MLPCPRCCAPRFSFSKPEEGILDSIPTNSLSVELGSSVKEVTQRIKQLDETSYSRGSHNAGLGAIDNAIRELSQSLQDLNTFRTQRLALAANMRARVPYIHLLPSDILSRVFLFCRCGCSFGTLKKTLIIASVCKRWKEVIERIPSRWTRFPTINVKRTNNYSLRLFKTWLKRSQDNPLSVNIAFTPDDPPGRGLRDAALAVSIDQGSSTTGVRDDVIALIAEAKPRIRSLTMEIGGSGVEELRCLGTLGFGALTILCVRLRPSTRHDSSFPPISALHDSPKLCELQLIYESREQFAPDLPSLVRLFPWHQITILVCQSYISTDDLVCLLRSAPLLKTFKFGIAPLPLSSDDGSENLEEINRHLGTVTHRGITRLELNAVDCQNADYLHNQVRDPIDDFLSRVTLPSVVDLIIWRNEEEDSLSRFGGFVERSGIGRTLEVLKIDPGPDATLPVPVEVLQSLTQLEHMHLKLSTQQLRFVAQKIARNGWLPLLRSLYLDCDQPGADTDSFIFLVTLFEELGGFRRSRAYTIALISKSPHTDYVRDEGSRSEIELVQVLIPQCDHGTIKGIFRLIDNWPRSGAGRTMGDTRTCISETEVMNDLEFMESLMNEPGDGRPDINVRHSFLPKFRMRTGTKLKSI